MVSRGASPRAIGVSALAVFSIASFFSCVFQTSQAQPLPNWPTAAAAKSVLNLAMPPRSLSICALSAPAGSPPPLGFRLDQ